MRPFSHSVLLAAGIIFFLTNPATAHPVPKSNHDRTVVVRLEAGSRPVQVIVLVDYRLEVDPATVILEDMKPFQDDIDIGKFQFKLDYFKEFTRIYAPILADHFIANINGADVEFTCTKKTATLHDEKGEPLGHLRCNFDFQATLKCYSDKENVFTFRESNYQEQEGLINLTLGSTANVAVVSTVEASDAVKKRATNERLPGDDGKLRLLQVRFRLGSGETFGRDERRGQETRAERPALGAGLPTLPESRAPRAADSGLLMLLFNWQGGYALLLLVCTGFGALHALTPGHGKTLVAAYLVGQRGTIGHAVLLGIVTTITHTGAVLVLALLLIVIPGINKDFLQTGLSLSMGLMIVCLGFFLLLQRLAGRADHIHVGGGHHHHHHGHDHVKPSDPAISTWNLIVLGITGGLIPCWDAIVLLVFAVGTNDLAIAFPMVLAFSIGLAGVLVLIGILVVKFRHFAGSRWGEGRLIRALPIVSALLVTGMGLWLCYEAVHG